MEMPEKKILSKCSVEQQTIFCDFLDKNPGLLNLKLNQGMGPAYNEKLWDELTLLLNGIGPVSKTRSEWRQSFWEWRSRVKRKHRERLCESHETDKNKLKPLSPLELRLLGLISKENTVGTNISEDRVTEVKVQIPKKIPGNKRLFKRRADRQIIFCDFLDKHPRLLDSKLNRDLSMGSQSNMRLWNELTLLLNANSIKSKSTREWKQSFYEWRSRVKKKNQELLCWNQTNKKPKPLTRLEHRLLDLIRTESSVIANVSQLGISHDKEVIDNPTVENNITVPNKSLTEDAITSTCPNEEPEFSHNHSKSALTSKVEESLEVFEKNKPCKCSAEQQMIFCDFLEKNPVLLNKKLNPNMSPSSYERLWDDLTRVLNASGKGSKTTKEWKQSFCEWRSRVRKKGRELRENHELNGNQMTLTIVEQRLLSLLGEENSVGSIVGVTSIKEEEVDLPTEETMIFSPIESSTQDLNEDLKDIPEETILLLSPNGYSTEQIVATTPMSFSTHTSRKRKMDMEVNNESQLSSKRNSSSDVHPNMEEDAQNSSAKLKTIDRMAHSMEEISDKFQSIQEHTVDMSQKMGNICESLKTIAESIKILANVSVARAKTEGLQINF